MYNMFFIHESFNRIFNYDVLTLRPHFYNFSQSAKMLTLETF